MLSRVAPLLTLTLLAALTSCQRSAPPSASPKASPCPPAHRDSAVAGARGYEDSSKAVLASSVGRSLAFACLDKLRGSAEERLEFDVAFEVDGEGHVVEVKVEPEGPSSAILQTCLDELRTKALLPPPDHPPGKVRSLLAVNNRAAGARPPAPSFIDVTQAYRVLDLDVQFYRHQDREEIGRAHV